MTHHPIRMIGFDADDTLWQNEHFYRLTEAHFRALLSDYADGDHISGRLLEAEKRRSAISPITGSASKASRCL